MAVAGELGLRGEQCFELVEAVRPTVPVKRAASFGLEQTLSEHDFRRLAEIPQCECVTSLYERARRRVPQTAATAGLVQARK